MEEDKAEGVSVMEAGIGELKIKNQLSDIAIFSRHNNGILLFGSHTGKIELVDLGGQKFGFQAVDFNSRPHHLTGGYDVEDIPDLWVALRQALAAREDFDITEVFAKALLTRNIARNEKEEVLNQ